MPDSTDAPKKPAAPRKPAAKKPLVKATPALKPLVTPVTEPAPDAAAPEANVIASVTSDEPAEETVQETSVDAGDDAGRVEPDGVAFIEGLFDDDDDDAESTVVTEKPELAAATPSFFRRPLTVTLDCKTPIVISSTVVLAMIIGALIGGLSGAAVTGLSGNIHQAVIINNPESVSDVAAAAAKASRSVVTLNVTGKDNGGSGSGVIISPDGYILTNAHVVTLDGAAGRNTIKVTSSQGQRYDAKIVGIDAVTDLAVIKIVDGAGFAPIAWADSAKVNVGDTAVSIGAPIGLSGTVTSGVVSALDRGVILNDPASKADGAEQGSIWIPAIQTDAAINHGNSGGPLLNNAGELIGVNVAIANVAGGAGQDSGNIGVGFAVEANVARRIANDIIDTGKASHGLLGATVAPATTDPDAEILGALVMSTVKGLPAEKAGLAAGDVIIRFNGKRITGSADLTAQVRAAKAGSAADVIFVRDGHAGSKLIRLGDLLNLEQ